MGSIDNLFLFDYTLPVIDLQQYSKDQFFKQNIDDYENIIIYKQQNSDDE